MFRADKGGIKMNQKEFQEFVQNKIIYLDGATGTNLQKAGMPVGVCPEEWILNHKQVMLELQKAYVDAGTTILYAPTFTGNRIKLKEYGLENRLEYIAAINSVTLDEFDKIIL